MSRKPPLGIIPRWILDEKRKAEIEEAIIRYKEVDFPIPSEWYEELDEINERLSVI